MSTNELPEGWIHTKLGKVVDYGKATKCNLEDVQPDTWVLELEDIEKGTSKLIQRIEASNRPFKSTKNVFKTGDVLYGKLRPYLNKVLVAETDGVCTTEIVPIDAEPFVNNRYLFYWFRGGQFLNYVEAVSYGVNMPRLGTKEGIDAPLVLAPIAEQKVIADKLDNLLSQVESIKARLERIPEILKQFRQSVLAAAVSGKLTEEWRKLNDEGGFSETTWEGILRDKKNSFKRGPFGSALKKSMFVESGFKVYEQYCPINDDCTYARYYITPEKFEEMKAFEVLDGDFLISCSGVSLGRITQVPFGSERGIINQALLRVRLNNQLYNDDFFKLVFRSPSFQKDLFENSTGSAIPNLKGVKELKAMVIPLPSLNEQKKIVELVNHHFEAISGIDECVRSALDRVNSLTQSILAKAFRGELTADWREANPELISGENSAEALLKRIKAERESAKPTTKRGRAKT
ncbi:restriction endonuclease subunit S [Acinetobacter baumannii]|nr:restriction endonuclease subunit S [Acinetobacter baumannii]MDV7545561.1 restriction endonuclease subunit S [Acinetobacter baumannii]